MVRFAPLAALALSPLVHARFDWLQARGAVEECPPCPANGDLQTCPDTVTVTEPSGPQKTITVLNPEDSYHTVTVKEPGLSGKTVTVTEYNDAPQTKFVYISQGETFYPPKETITVTYPGKTVTVTKTESEEHIVTKVKVYPGGGPGNSNGDGYQPGLNTITITGGYVAPSAGYPDYDGGVVTKVIGGGGEKENYGADVQTVTVVHDGEIKVLTITNSDDNKVIKTITQEGGEEKIVTVTGSGSNKAVKTITLGGGEEKIITVSGNSQITKTVTLEDGKEEVVTVTRNDNKVVKTLTVEGSNDYVVTKTIQEDGKHYTVIIKPEPTITTITKDNGDCITTVVEVPCTYTLTAPAQYATATVTGDAGNYQTITRTATYGVEPEVEIIVYDPETGNSTCKRKEDGLPCHPDYNNDGTHSGDDDDKPHYGGNDKGQDGDDNGRETYIDAPNYTKIRTDGEGQIHTDSLSPDETDCDSVATSTSIATVFNTVVVTVGADSSEGASAPTTLAVKHPRDARGSRSPLFVRW
ncbi:hypothetical protein NM208_g13689 [Fusarium decemcellulare]|uniref:Uncharacterized protein n=1 Tax=Fusarium decemcellulare TaxID=57161 RepID=A0ACC1RIY3_9HYPO|nr:hypothetical protein NM208_g13689 [Fusarium decemcellulare]